MKFSIIICEFNSDKYIVYLLRCLSEQTFKDFEVIRVDNNTINRGFSGGMNLGAKAAKGEWLICLNPDVSFGSDFLQKIADKTDKVAENVGNLSIKELDKDGKVRHYGAFLSMCRHPLMLKVPDKKKLFTGLGACQVYRKAAFDAVGGFDESYFLYGEDTNLSWQIKRNGWKIAPCWNASLKHLQFGSEQKKTISVYYAHRNTLWTLFKNNTRKELLLYLPWIIGGQLCCFLINPTHMPTVLKAKIDALIEWRKRR